MIGLRSTDNSKGRQPGSTSSRTVLLENVTTGLTDVVLTAHFLQYVNLLHRRLPDLFDLLLAHLVRGCDVDDLHRVLLGGALVDAAAHHAAHSPADRGHPRARAGNYGILCHENMHQSLRLSRAFTHSYQIKVPLQCFHLLWSGSIELTGPHPKLFFASDCGWILIVITQVGVYFIPPVLSKLMESEGWSNGPSHVKNSRAAGRPVTLWFVSVCNYIIWSSHQLGPGCSQHPTSKCQLMNAVSLNTVAYVTAPTDNGLGARLLLVPIQSRKVSQNATTKCQMKLEATLYFMTGFILDRVHLLVPLVHFSRTLSLALLLCSSTPEQRQKPAAPAWNYCHSEWWSKRLLFSSFCFWGESVTVWSLECLKPPPENCCTFVWG